MNILKSFAVFGFVSVSFFAAACYQAPTSNSSRSSTSVSPTAEKPASPTASAPATPEKSGNYEQALSDYKSKNFEKAETGFKEVLSSEPNHADANFYLGNIYYDRKEYEKSLPHYLEATKKDFKSPEKLMALGENQRALKQFDRAIVQYSKVIGFEPNNARAYYGLGLTYIGLNNKIGARQQLQKLEPLDKSLAEKLSKEIGDSK